MGQKSLIKRGLELGSIWKSRPVGSDRFGGVDAIATDLEQPFFGAIARGYD